MHEYCTSQHPYHLLAPFIRNESPRNIVYDNHATKDPSNNKAVKSYTTLVDNKDPYMSIPPINQRAHHWYSQIIGCNGWDYQPSYVECKVERAHVNPYAGRIL